MSRENARGVRGVENQTSAGEHQRGNIYREKCTSNVRGTLRIAPSKVQKSMYRLKRAFPLEPALAYIVWPTRVTLGFSRYPRLRDSESINPRNYFRRGGGGSRVIDAYSYELA